MRIAIEAAKFTPEEANQLAPLHGDVPQRRHHPSLLRQDGRRHGGARLHAGLRRTLLPPDRGLRHLRFPGKPRRQLRAAGLCLGLVEMPPPGGVRLCAAEFAADGVLCAGADRARCARAWRGGARHRCGRQRMGLHDRGRCAASGFPPDHRIFAGMGGTVDQATGGGDQAGFADLVRIGPAPGRPRAAGGSRCDAQPRSSIGALRCGRCAACRT